MESTWFESTLKEDSLYERLEEGIYSFIPLEIRGHAYDAKVEFYDRVVGSLFWNRFVWQNHPSAYDTFCAETLPAKKGMILDAGCGSLVFTENAYAGVGSHKLILLDRSLGMLSKAKQRLEKRFGHMPENIILVQADVFELPFKNDVFDVVNAFGMIHVFSDTENFLKSLHRVKVQEGELNMLSLVANNLLSKGVMSLLKRKGELAHIFSTEELKKHMEEHHQSCQIDTMGNICYIRCQ